MVEWVWVGEEEWAAATEAACPEVAWAVVMEEACPEVTVASGNGYTAPTDI